MIRNFSVLRLFLLLFTLVFSAVVYAKEINLYDAPKADAKATGKIDLSVGIIPIYTPKEGGWVKVADPRNGNVGWVKTSDTNGSHTTVTFTRRIINDGKEPQTYQFIQYGGSQGEKLTPEQIQQLQKWQQRQQAIQQSMQNAYMHMMQEMENLYRQSFSNFGQLPFFMPVVIVPEQKQKPAEPTPPVQTKPAASTQKPTATPQK